MNNARESRRGRAGGKPTPALPPHSLAALLVSATIVLSFLALDSNNAYCDDDRNDDVRNLAQGLYPGGWPVVIGRRDPPLPLPPRRSRFSPARRRFDILVALLSVCSHHTANCFGDLE